MKRAANFAIALGMGLQALSCIDSTGYGPPAAMNFATFNDQRVPVGTAAVVSPAVRVVDAKGAGVPNVKVVFIDKSGKGVITGAERMSDANGVATVGSWTVGDYGRQELWATSDELMPLMLTAIGTAPTEGIPAFDIEDASGDSPMFPGPGLGMDIIELAGELKLDSLIVTMTFAAPIPESKEWSVLLQFDTDGNLTTPMWDFDEFGFERWIRYSGKGRIENGTDLYNQPIVTLESSSITFRLSLDEVDYQVAGLRFSASVRASDGRWSDSAPDGEPGRISLNAKNSR